MSIFFITGTFTTETMNVCLHEQNVYCIEAMKVQVRTHQVKTESFKVAWSICIYFPLALTISKIYKSEIFCLSGYSQTDYKLFGARGTAGQYRCMWKLPGHWNQYRIGQSVRPFKKVGLNSVP